MEINSSGMAEERQIDFESNWRDHDCCWIGSDRARKATTARLNSSLQDKYLLCFPFLIFLYRLFPLCLISRFPFVDSIATRLCLPMDVGTQEALFNKIHISLCACFERGKSAGTQIDKCIYCLLLWYFKVMRFSISFSNKSNAFLKWRLIQLQTISLKVDFNHISFSHSLFTSRFCIECDFEVIFILVNGVGRLMMYQYQSQFL